ncbi:MAG TPA: hypothetical protein VD763_13275, partial [Candidatus Saccharimonadales bacterium]|nr:hypothetical protein [Candidatus Saccharimonadales bacterium]
MAGGRTVRSLEPSATAVAELDPEPTVESDPVMDVAEPAAGFAEAVPDVPEPTIPALPDGETGPPPPDEADDGLPRWSDPVAADVEATAPPIPAVLRDAGEPLPGSTLARWDAEPPSAGSGAGLAAAFAMPRSVMASAGATAMATPGAYVPPAPV